MKTFVFRAGREAVSETYEELRGELEKLAAGFAKKYHRDAEDVMGEVNLLFVEKFHKFDPTAGMSLWNFLRQTIWNLLLTRITREVREKKNLGNLPLPAVLVARPERSFDAEEAGLDGDAREVLALAAEAETAGRSVYQVRDEVRDRLAARGWGRNRVKRAFRVLRGS